MFEKLFNSCEYCIYKFTMSGSKFLSINEFSTLVMSKSLIEVNDYIYLSTINLSYIQYLLPTFDLSHIFLSERQNFWINSKDFTGLCKQCSQILENIFQIDVQLSVYFLHSQNMSKESFGELISVYVLWPEFKWGINKNFGGCHLVWTFYLQCKMY